MLRSSSGEVDSKSLRAGSSFGRAGVRRGRVLKAQAAVGQTHKPALKGSGLDLEEHRET